MIGPQRQGAPTAATSIEPSDGARRSLCSGRIGFGAAAFGFVALGGAFMASQWFGASDAAMAYSMRGALGDVAGEWKRQAEIGALRQVVVSDGEGVRLWRGDGLRASAQEVAKDFKIGGVVSLTGTDGRRRQMVVHSITPVKLAPEGRTLAVVECRSIDDTPAAPLRLLIELGGEQAVTGKMPHAL